MTTTSTLHLISFACSDFKNNLCAFHHTGAALLNNSTAACSPNLNHCDSIHFYSLLIQDGTIRTAVSSPKLFSLNTKWSRAKSNWFFFSIPSGVYSFKTLLPVCEGWLVALKWLLLLEDDLLEARTRTYTHREKDSLSQTFPPVDVSKTSSVYSIPVNLSCVGGFKKNT